MAGLAELGINKRLIQNKIILAELMGKEPAYRDKDSEAGDKEMVSESNVMKVAQRQPLNIVNIKS